jgi:hypothetical protein
MAQKCRFLAGLPAPGSQMHAPATDTCIICGCVTCLLPLPTCRLGNFIAVTLRHCVVLCFPFPPACVSLCVHVGPLISLTWPCIRCTVQERSAARRIRRALRELPDKAHRLLCAEGDTFTATLATCTPGCCCWWWRRRRRWRRAWATAGCSQAAPVTNFVAGQLWPWRRRRWWW